MDMSDIYISEYGGAGANTCDAQIQFTGSDNFSIEFDSSEISHADETTTLKLLLEDGRVLESPLPPQDQWQLDNEYKWEKWQVIADEEESGFIDANNSIYNLQIKLNDSDGDWLDDFIVRHEQGLCWLMDFLPALFKYEGTPVCHIVGAKVYKRI